MTNLEELKAIRDAAAAEDYAAASAAYDKACDERNAKLVVSLYA